MSQRPQRWRTDRQLSTAPPGVFSEAGHSIRIQAAARTGHAARNCRPVLLAS